MKIFVQSVIIMAVLLVGPVVAEQGDPPSAKKRVRYKQKESHKFGSLSLKGRLKKPELGYIYKRGGLRQEKIINIPEHFNGEIIQGAGRF